MNFINKTHITEKIYNLYSKELHNSLHMCDYLIQLFINRLIPQINLVTSSHAEEDIEQARGILLGFFQACYVKQMSYDKSNETFQKATLLFNQILRNSEAAHDPALYMQEELYKGLQRAQNPSWEPYDKREKFIEEDNTCRFSADYRYANTQLQIHFPNISPMTLNQLAYYLALMNLSFAYVYKRRRTSKSFEF